VGIRNQRGYDRLSTVIQNRCSDSGRVADFVVHPFTDGHQCSSNDTSRRKKTSTRSSSATTSATTWIYVARVRAGFVPALRVKVFERFHKLAIKSCPFSNLPRREKGKHVIDCTSSVRLMLVDFQRTFVMQETIHNVRGLTGVGRDDLGADAKIVPHLQT
jgi:hypothetical protein